MSTKSVSRDISDLKAFFAEQRDLVGNSELEYSYQDWVYRFRLDKFLSSKELFTLAEVFLGARAFSKIDLLNPIDKLKRLTSPEDRKRLAPLIQREVYHYHEVHHDCDSVQDTLWQLILSSASTSGGKSLTVTIRLAGSMWGDEYVRWRFCSASIIFYLIAFRADK